MRLSQQIIKLIIICVTLLVLTVSVYQLLLLNNSKRIQSSNTSGTYTVEDNTLLKNIPPSQIKNAFNLMDKSEFMSVMGLTRMGYNDTYLIGERSGQFILYRFGEKDMQIYQDKYSLNMQLEYLGQQITFKTKDAY